MKHPSFLSVIWTDPNALHIAKKCFSKVLSRRRGRTKLSLSIVMNHVYLDIDCMFYLVSIYLKPNNDMKLVRSIVVKAIVT